MVKGSITLKQTQIKSAREVLIINIITEAMLIKVIVIRLDGIFFMAKFFMYLDIDLETIKKQLLADCVK